MVDENSQLKLVCIGVVAFDKPTATDIIQVYPTERLAFEDGDVPNSKEDMETDVVDISGVPFKAKVVRTAVITAKWFPDGDDGRQTAPDVINGETVKIYRYSDSVDYYWKTMFREPNLRRLEHVVHAYSDLKTGRDIFGLDSSYGTIFSTKDKYIKIWTSLSDEEKFNYEFKIDTQSSYYLMTDNIGNKFGFISEEEKIYLENSAGSFIEAVKDSIEINSGDIVKVVTGHVLINGVEDVNINTSSSTLTASGNSVINSPNVRINTSNFNVGGGGDGGSLFRSSAVVDEIPSNKIGLNDEEVTAYLENSDGSYIRAIREDINIHANKNILISTPCENANSINDEKLVIMVPTVEIGNKDLEDLPFRLQVFGDIIANRIFIMPDDGIEDLEDPLNFSNLPDSPVSLQQTIVNLSNKLNSFTSEVSTVNDSIDNFTTNISLINDKINELFLEIDLIKIRIASLP